MTTDGFGIGVRYDELTSPLSLPMSTVSLTNSSILVFTSLSTVEVGYTAYDHITISCDPASHEEDLCKQESHPPHVRR